MSPAPAFPPSPILAGWSHQLAPHQPRLLAVAYLRLHRVEFLAQVEQEQPLDRLSWGVLAALSRTTGVLEKLQEDLGLPRQFLLRILADLAALRLAHAESGHYQLTELGRRVQERGTGIAMVAARRTLHFREMPHGRPQFLPLASSAGRQSTAEATWHFDPALLAECIGQSSEWKEQRGFPRDLVSAWRADAANCGIATWKKVVLDLPVTLPALLVLSGSGAEEKLLGFAFSPDDWLLDARQPLFAIGHGWNDVFPELAGDHAAEWKHAWEEWCAGRGVPASDGAADIHYTAGEIRVKTPASLFPAEPTWLIAGHGEVRLAARVISG